MNSTLLTALVSGGVFIGLGQLLLAIAALIRQKANAIVINTKLEASARVLNTKIDQNTDMTKDIHKATNGTLTALASDVSKIASSIDANSETARATAETARVQAVTDAKASQDKV